MRVLLENYMKLHVRGGGGHQILNVCGRKGGGANKSAAPPTPYYFEWNSPLRLFSLLFMLVRELIHIIHITGNGTFLHIIFEEISVELFLSFVYVTLTSS